MKNLKNMLSAAILMAVMVFGSVSANAGLLQSDTTESQCTGSSSGILEDFASIINGLTGINIFDAPTPACTEKIRQTTAGRARWS